MDADTLPLDEVARVIERKFVREAITALKVSR